MSYTMLEVMRKCEHALVAVCEEPIQGLEREINESKFLTPEEIQTAKNLIVTVKNTIWDIKQLNTFCSDY